MRQTHLTELVDMTRLWTFCPLAADHSSHLVRDRVTHYSLTLRANLLDSLATLAGRMSYSCSCSVWQRIAAGRPWTAACAALAARRRRHGCSQTLLLHSSDHRRAAACANSQRLTIPFSSPARGGLQIGQELEREKREREQSLLSIHLSTSAVN